MLTDTGTLFSQAIMKKLTAITIIMEIFFIAICF